MSKYGKVSPRFRKYFDRDTDMPEAGDRVRITSGKHSGKSGGVVHVDTTTGQIDVELELDTGQFHVCKFHSSRVRKL